MERGHSDLQLSCIAAGFRGGFMGLYTFREQAGGLCVCVWIVFQLTPHLTTTFLLLWSIIQWLPFPPYDSAIFLHSLSTCDDLSFHLFSSCRLISLHLATALPPRISFLSPPLFSISPSFLHFLFFTIIPLCLHLSSGGFQMWGCQDKRHEWWQSGEQRFHGRRLVPDERRRGAVWRVLPIVARCQTHFRCSLPTTGQFFLSVFLTHKHLCYCSVPSYLYSHSLLALLGGRSLCLNAVVETVQCWMKIEFSVTSLIPHFQISKWCLMIFSQLL